MDSDAQISDLIERSTLDCGSLLPLSLASLLADPSIIVPDSKTPGQAASTKAAAGFRSPKPSAPLVSVCIVIVVQHRAPAVAIAAERAGEFCELLLEQHDIGVGRDHAAGDINRP